MGSLFKRGGTWLKGPRCLTEVKSYPLDQNACSGWQNVTINEGIPKKYCCNIQDLTFATESPLRHQ